MLYVCQIEPYICCCIVIYCCSPKSWRDKNYQQFRIVEKETRWVQSKNGNGRKFILTFLTLPKEKKTGNGSWRILLSIFSCCVCLLATTGQKKTRLKITFSIRELQPYTKAFSSRSLRNDCKWILSINSLFSALKVNWNTIASLECRVCQLMNIILWRYPAMISLSHQVSLENYADRLQLDIFYRLFVDWWTEKQTKEIIDLKSDAAAQKNTHKKHESRK